ncbi:MAG: glycosyltransferase family 4 protein [Patescibacteria group bacterium]
MNNIKKLIVTLEFPPQVGGISSYIHNFLLHVNADDYVLYAPLMPGANEFDAKNPWKTYRYSPYFPFWPHWLRMFFQILSILKKEKISEIHIHQVLPCGYLGWLIWKIKKIPYLIFLHGSDVAVGTRSAWKTNLFSFVLRNSRRIVANSQFLENRVKQRIENIGPITVLYPCPSNRFLEIIPESELGALRDKLAVHGKKVILTVSRMVDGKGYPHIVRLLSEVCREVPNLVWIFIGDGPKKQSIVDLVQRHYLQNVVRFLGALPNDELPKYYQIADLFVLLSHQDEEAEESWGSVFLEASASGNPIVAGRVGGVEEAVDNLRSGVVVDVYQGKAVVNAIVSLLRNDKYAKELGRWGRERVQKEFRWETQIAKLDE